MLAAPRRWLGVFVAMVAGTALLFTRLPGSFLPQEDQGYLVTVIQAPPGATTQRTNEATKQVKAFFAEQPQVANVVSVNGFSFFGQRSEEHTSELQSLMRISYAVFCLKKKNTNTKQLNT